MNNPYILLRVLIMIDVALMIFGVLLPLFKEIGLWDLISAISNSEGLALITNLLYYVSLSAVIIGWIGIFMVKNWGRYVYVSSVLPMILIVFMNGGAIMPGIRGVNFYITNIYFGFFVAMLFFGHVSIVFNGSKAQQVRCN